VAGGRFPDRGPVVLSLDQAGIRAVIFDVDGTLYDHGALRRRMRSALLRHCLAKPSGFRTLLILKAFREMREALAEEEASEVAVEQYARPARRLGIPVETVRRTVETWMHEHPLAYLPTCRFDGIDRLFDGLRRSGRPIAVLSDYPSAAKLKALGLEADLHVSAVDPEIDRLKPNPKGLLHAVARLGLEPSQCLLVGDRDERDGECARRAGVPYLIKAKRQSDDGIRFGHFNRVTQWLCAERCDDLGVVG